MAQCVAGSIDIIVEGANAGVRTNGLCQRPIRGNLNIDANGNVSLRGTAAAGAITVRGADVVQEKDFTAGQSIEINANNLTVAKGGAIQTAESLTINASQRAVIYGDTQVRGGASITAASGIVIGEEFITGGGVTLNTEGTVTFAEGVFSSPTLAINAAATETQSGATLMLTESLVIDGGDVDFAAGSYLVATNATIDLLNNDRFNNAAQISGETLNANGVVGFNDIEGLIQVDNFGIEYSGSFSNAGKN